MDNYVNIQEETKLRCIFERTGEKMTGRIYIVNWREGVRYFFRVSLHHICSAKIFQDLRTGDEHTNKKYREKYFRLGLFLKIVNGKGHSETI